MKFLTTCLVAVTFLALAAQFNNPLAADGSQPAIKTATTKPIAAKPAAGNPPAAISERELRKQIQKAWRKREERVRTLLLVYVMTHKDGPEQAQRKRNIAELIKKRAARIPSLSNASRRASRRHRSTRNEEIPKPTAGTRDSQARPR